MESAPHISSCSIIGEYSWLEYFENYVTSCYLWAGLFWYLMKWNDKYKYILFINRLYNLWKMEQCLGDEKILPLNTTRWKWSFIVEYPPPVKDGQKQNPRMDDDLLLFVVLLACPVWPLSAAEESGRCNEESSSTLLSPWSSKWCTLPVSPVHHMPTREVSQCSLSCCCTLAHKDQH